MSNSRKGTPAHIRCLLWGRAAGRCEFSGCNRELTLHPITKNAIGIAEEAHIVAYTPNGPRGDKDLSNELCRDISNLMLVCHDCHKEIDGFPEKYSVDTLRRMKLAHENRIRLVGSISADRESHFIMYGANIGNESVNLNASRCIEAMLPDWYPANEHGISLGLGNSFQFDDSDGFWNFEAKQLEAAFRTSAIPELNASPNKHICVFALAPQPLLVFLGSLLTELRSISVYQLHREPNRWKWETESANVEFELSEPTEKNGTPVLVFALSASVDNQRIEQVVPDASIWKITIDNPNNDFLKTEATLSRFRVIVRRTLNAIKAAHPAAGEISIFPAMPTSAAIELGRVRMPKADLPFLIWDENRNCGGFRKALRIGEQHDRHYRV